MLIELLKLVQAGGTLQLADLARQLGTTPALVELMLQDLARMGYLKQAKCRSEQSECGECSAGKACQAQFGGQAWVLGKTS